MELSPEKTVNGTTSYKNVTNNRKTIETGERKIIKPFRLTIQIDKIYLRPCPKSKKRSQVTINIESAQKAEETLQNLRCLVCKKRFSSTSKMYEHLKEHFICDICNTEFSSQKSIKKHSKIHLSENPQQPYKCHICDKLFQTKDTIKKHSHIILDKYADTDDGRIHYCNTCNVSFKNESFFRRHLASHVESELKDAKEKMVKSKLPNFGQSKPVLFNCRICNQNFNYVADIDKHTKTHMEELESMN